MIRKLTQLCSFAGWDSCNLAAKYLQIICYALADHEDYDNIEYITLYRTITIALEEIAYYLAGKLAMQPEGMTHEDHEIFSQLISCGALICVNVPFIKLSKFTETSYTSLSGHSLGKVRSPQQKGIEFLIEKLVDDQLFENFIKFLISDLERSLKMTQ